MTGLNFAPTPRLPTVSLGLVLGAMITGCATYPPITTATQVDLPRFMGDWRVLAHIPASIERDAWDAVESYQLDEDGTVATTYSFRVGGFDGKEKVYNPRGFVRDTDSNAVWGMQFIWPFKMEYRILYVDEDYTQTIIGRSKRDYLWIMARTPQIPAEDLDELIEFCLREGYDTSQLRIVPQPVDSLGTR